MITAKDYQCPYCKSTQKITTNHYGETFSGCKTCRTVEHMGVMYPLEDERTFNTEAYVVCYRLYLDVVDERKKYNKLSEYVVGELGYDKFDTYAMPYGKETERQKHIENNSLRCIMIHKPETFEDQYITDTGRLHQWQESIFANEDVKQGYIVTFSKDIHSKLKSIIA